AFYGWSVVECGAASWPVAGGRCEAHKINSCRQFTPRASPTRKAADGGGGGGGWQEAGV
ncbi:hypothetical protein JYU34_002493, partial [Plutella xylostella]